MIVGMRVLTLHSRQLKAILFRLAFLPSPSPPPSSPSSSLDSTSLPLPLPFLRLLGTTEPDGEAVAAAEAVCPSMEVEQPNRGMRLRLSVRRGGLRKRSSVRGVSQEVKGAEEANGRAEARQAGVVAS